MDANYLLKNKKMVVLFDLDSTISKIEGLDYLATLKGLGNEIKLITEKTMSGEMSFQETFPKKINLLSPSIKEQEKLGFIYLKNLSLGFELLLNKLFKNNIKVGILSANFEIPIKILADKLNINHDLCFCNKTEFFENGDFKYFDDSQLLAQENGKGVVISSLKSKFPRENVVFIGDSVGDMFAGKNADMFIGYGGAVKREQVYKNSEHFVIDFLDVCEIISEHFFTIK